MTKNYLYFRIDGDPDIIVRGDDDDILDWAHFNSDKQDWDKSDAAYWFDTCVMQAYTFVHEIDEAEALRLISRSDCTGSEISRRWLI